MNFLLQCCLLCLILYLFRFISSRKPFPKPASTWTKCSKLWRQKQLPVTTIQLPYEQPIRSHLWKALVRRNQNGGSMCCRHIPNRGHDWSATSRIPTHKQIHLTYILASCSLSNVSGDFLVSFKMLLLGGFTGFDGWFLKFRF